MTPSLYLGFYKFYNSIDVVFNHFSNNYISNSVTWVKIIKDFDSHYSLYS